MADKHIGALSPVETLNDDSLFVVEQQGAAKSVTGRLFQQFAREGVETYVSEAKEAVESATALLEDTQKSLGQIGDSVERCEAAATTAQQYSEKPPIVQYGSNWWVWDADSQQYTDSGKRAVLGYDISYPSVAAMNADNSQPNNTVAIIASDVNDEDNAKVFLRENGTWRFLADLSGSTGVGVASVEQTSGNHASGTTDVYTLSLTDGTTQTIPVYNGKDGDGAGDMVASIYDPNSKSQDIFAYADAIETETKKYADEVGTDAKKYADEVGADAEKYTDSSIDDVEATLTEIKEKLSALITYGTSDLTAGTSPLATGTLYVVYE